MAGWPNPTARRQRKNHQSLPARQLVASRAGLPADGARSDDTIARQSSRCDCLGAMFERQRRSRRERGGQDAVSVNRASMNAKEILKELKPLGRESYKRVLCNNHGIKEPCFGVPVSELKKFQKRIKKD